MATSTSNLTPILSARNPLLYPLAVQNEPAITLRQAVIYIQSVAGGDFDLPINANAPLITINRNNTYNFNLQAILQDNPHFQSVARPSLLSFTAQKLVNFSLDYQIQSKIVSQDVITKSETFTAINAKIARKKWNADGQNALKNRLGNNGIMFLQGGPRYRIISESSHSFLYFLFNLDPCPEGVAVVADFFDADFSSISSVKYSEIHELKQNDVYQLNVSLPKLRDIVPPDFSHYSITLYNVNEAGVLGEQFSESFFFYLDESITDLPERTIYFKNLFGVWDTFRISEGITTTTEYSREVFANENLETIDNSVQLSTKLAIPTGVLSQGWLSYLSEDLCTSKDIFYVDDTETVRLKSVMQSLETDSFNPNEQTILEFEIAQKTQY
ncbi:hypothetical protein LV89_01977 [Arcicella aurantiaca]|uniref:Uncharacterized protein n=1 Tax=Arcicella aurantiaca TaxID=591202 RepID=A0A316EAK4_9BACT|nr:hypothetical protein [Arcicella aurantiaca]PWK27162.1 hypothetical protein LV89_01977 [Arcicella aurantiaca]